MHWNALKEDFVQLERQLIWESSINFIITVKQPFCSNGLLYDIFFMWSMADEMTHHLIQQTTATTVESQVGCQLLPTPFLSPIGLPLPSHTRRNTEQVLFHAGFLRGRGVTPVRSAEFIPKGGSPTITPCMYLNQFAKTDLLLNKKDSASISTVFFQSLSSIDTNRYIVHISIFSAVVHGAIVRFLLVVPHVQARALNR